MDSTIVYVKIEKASLLNKKTVTIQDVAKVYSSDKKIVDKLNSHVILNITAKKKKVYVFSSLKLFEEIHKIYPKLDIENIGEQDFIIQYEPPKKTIKILEFGKVAFIGIIIFFGAAFTIMTFNEDVSVKTIFESLYTLIDKEKMGSNIIEISYAIGLPIGIIVFFNHFSKAKITDDPTPMQIQLRLYEKNLNDAIIEDASRDGKIIDSK